MVGGAPGLNPTIGPAHSGTPLTIGPPGGYLRRRRGAGILGSVAAMFGNKQKQEQIDRLVRKNRDLGALVVQLAERAGVTGAELDRLRADTEPGLTTQVQQLVAGGKMIEAIKEYRVATGAGLKEAKDAVEEYARRMQ